MILYLAPLQGFTDHPFRNSYSKFFSGFDIAIAPFISILPDGRYKKKEMRDVLPEKNFGLPVIPQIMGNNAGDFLPVAEKLYDYGYTSINWNLGCPYKMVAKKKRGSGLLCFPDDIKRFLDEALPKIKNTLSIKMRLGRYSEDEIFTLIPIFNQYPIDEITIHPRTGIQMYEGEVNLDQFEKVLEVSEHTIVYNGDITDVASFNKLQKRFPVIERWMIGRGVLSDPFLPMTIRQQNDQFDDAEPSGNKTEIIRLFHNDYYEQRLEYLNGPAHLTDRMKAFWFHLAGSLENGDKFFKKIKKVKTPEQYKIIVNQFFDSGPEWLR